VCERYKKLLLQLKKHLDNCYENYINEIMQLENEQLIESASEIVAVKEVYQEMRFWLELSMTKIVWPNGFIKKPLEKDDAINLITQKNPLIELANKWWVYTLGSRANFYEFFHE